MQNLKCFLMYPYVNIFLTHNKGAKGSIKRVISHAGELRAQFRNNYSFAFLLVLIKPRPFNTLCDANNNFISC